MLRAVAVPIPPDSYACLPTATTVPGTSGDVVDVVSFFLRGNTRPPPKSEDGFCADIQPTSLRRGWQSGRRILFSKPSAVGCFVPQHGLKRRWLRRRVHWAEKWRLLAGGGSFVALIAAWVPVRRSAIPSQRPGQTHERWTDASWGGIVASTGAGMYAWMHRRMHLFWGPSEHYRKYIGVKP